MPESIQSIRNGGCGAWYAFAAMRRRRVLIESPLKWHVMEMTGAAPVRHPVVPVIAERGGTQLHAPRAVPVHSL